MSACTIPFEATGKAEVGKRKVDGMTTEIKSLGFRPPLSAFPRGVLVNSGGLPTQVGTRGPGGVLVYRGRLTTELRLEAGDWGREQELRKLRR